jgi:hypothetical protein
MKLSKPFYIGSIVGGMGLGMVAGILAVLFGMSSHLDEAAIPFALLGGAAMLYGVIILLLLIHKMWSAIQDGQARTTPAQAVSFLFIPFFNLYWIFQVYYGWAKDYNAYVKRHSISAPPMAEGLFLAVPVLALCGVIPLLGILCALANIVAMLIMFSQAIDGVNALAAAPPRAAVAVASI